MPAVAAFDVTAIVVNYNTRQLLDEMFAALRAASAGLRVQTIVIDNASRDDSVAHLRAHYPDVQLIVNTTNVGFGRANNQALPFVRGAFVLLLNTDAFVAPESLARTLAFMRENPACGLLGVRLVGRDGVLQPSCRFFPTPWNVFLGRTDLLRHFPNVQPVDDMTWDHASVRECDWVPGCYYLVRADVVAQVGLFDPRFFLYFEEVDHCKAVKAAGWKVMYVPTTTVVHIGGESAKGDAGVSTAGSQATFLQIESELLYYRKHFGIGGALLAVFLTALAFGLLIASSVLKTRRLDRAKHLVWHVRATVSTFLRTGLGTHPTR